jgi:tol-pal system protein YbgF
MWTLTHALTRGIALRGVTARAVACAAVVASTSLLFTPEAAAAANREHQQIVADIRMLQEQTQQLQVSLGQLTDVLKTIATRLDDQSNVTRKAFADQKLIIDGLTGEIRIVREKLDDTNVRLSSLSQEVESLRSSPSPSPTFAPSPGTSTPEGGATPGATPPEAGGTNAVAPPTATATGAPPAGAAPTPPPAAPPAVGMSPTRLYELAQADYAGGQWALAINGFETYLRTFPKTDRADDAQFFIGEAYQLDGKFKESVAAYDKVITDFPSGDRVPDAYYKRGLAYSRLGQNDKARESFEAVIRDFPNAEASRLAKQLLDRLSRGARE